MGHLLINLMQSATTNWYKVHVAKVKGIYLKKALLARTLAGIVLDGKKTAKAMLSSKPESG